MKEIKIPNQALILVGDGAKALFLRNTGTAQELKLEIEEVFIHENPATHEQGTDRPGRTASSVGTARSAMGGTDWHRLEEERFAVELSDTLYRLAHAGKFDALVVVTPAKVLGNLRKAFHKEVSSRMSGELGKDLTSHSVADIEKLLTAAMQD